MKKNTKKLLAYSAAATCFMIVSQYADAQDVYTDLDPDSVWLPLETWFYTSDDILYIDMDHDGHRDFKFLNLSYYHEYYYGTDDEFRQRVWVGNVYWADHDKNFMAASTASFYTIYDSWYIKAYPFALDLGAIISNKLSWVGGWYQHMLDRIYEYSVYSTGTITNPHGNWYPEPGDTIADKYLGVKFHSGIDNKTHYGWIRCSVIDHHEDGFELIVKDYAYESKPNRPIAAGDMIGDTSVIHKNFLDIVIEPGTGTPITESNTNEAVIYSFEKAVYIYLPDELLNNTTIKIYNLVGESIYRDAVHSAITEIDLSAYSTGAYLVEILTEVEKQVNKVWIE